MKITTLLFSIVLLIGCICISTLADSPKSGSGESQPARINEKLSSTALNIQLDGISGKKFSLADEKHSIVVFFFLGLECPVANTYVSEVRDLQAKFEKQKDKIAWLGVHSFDGVALDAAKKHTEEYKLQLPVLLDPQQKMAHELGAKVLGQVVVLQDNKVVYRGRIDDRFAANGRRRDVASTHELADVLTALIDGKEISVSETKAYGCPIPK